MTSSMQGEIGDGTREKVSSAGVVQSARAGKVSA